MSVRKKSAPPDPVALAVTPDFNIRSETAADGPWIEALHEKCFGPGRFARAAYRVREWLHTEPELNFCALFGQMPVASVRMTPIGLAKANGYLLGPLATDPDYRNKGAGRQLVRHVTALAMQRTGCRFVLLVGDESYYRKLGYRRATGPIIFPGPVDPHRILVHGPPDGAPGVSGTLGPSN